jgi:hypothetical protein
MEIFRGEQFYRYLAGEGLDYDLCSQIVLCIYEKTRGSVAVNFVKVQDAQFPNAPLVERSDNPNFKLMIFLSAEITEKLQPGEYMIEAKRVINGVKMPIIKGVSTFLKVKDSKTI